MYLVIAAALLSFGQSAAGASRVLLVLCLGLSSPWVRFRFGSGYVHVFSDCGRSPEVLGRCATIWFSRPFGFGFRFGYGLGWVQIQV